MTAKKPTNAGVAKVDEKAAGQAAMAEKAEKAQADADQVYHGLALRRISGGSERRCNRARHNLASAIDAYAAEMDRQVYKVDEDGKRAEGWRWLDEVRDFKERLAGVHNQLNGLRQSIRADQD